MNLRAIVITVLAGLALSGCTTVRGSQDAPAAFASPRKMIRFDQALSEYGQRTGASREVYRDWVIDLYLGETENQYRRFKQQLNSADRGSALAGDLLLLGLSGATALAGAGAVDELATVTAVATGARATIDKRLFFDRTMPAVIAAMDARRASIKAEIATRRKLPDDQYSLGEALDDIHRLVDAGNINVAVEQITADAKADKVAAEARLAKIVEGCTKATRATADMNTEFRTFLMEDPAREVSRTAAAATLLEATAADGKASTRYEVLDAFDRKYCGDEGKRAFIDAFKAKVISSEGGL